MKTLKITLFSALAIIVTSCKGGIIHNRLATGTISRDCSGTYFRIASVGDYLICNDALVKDSNEGDEVQIIYDFTKDCPEKEGMAVCMLYHEKKGMIRIKTLK